MSGAYWDLPEQERAALTAEQVESFLDYELMTAGVVKPRKVPTIDEVPDVPELEHVQVAVVTVETKFHSRADSIAFASIDDAEAFLKLRPLRVDWDYDAGSRFQYAEPFHSSAAQVEVRRVVEHGSFIARRDELKRVEAARKAAQKQIDEFQVAQKKADQATEGVWNDWHAMREKAARCEEVLATFAEYRRLTGGDDTLAAKFLAKAFGEQRIADAEEWSGLDLGVPPAPALADDERGAYGVDAALDPEIAL